jgi:hypothetical protein
MAGSCQYQARLSHHETEGDLGPVPDQAPSPSHQLLLPWLWDLQTQKWQTFGIQDLSIQELQVSMKTLTPTKATTSTSFATLPTG